MTKQDFEKLEAFEKQIMGPIPSGFEIKIAYPSLSNPFNIF